MSQSPRRFFAHLRDDHRHAAKLVPDAESPIDAAILFLESYAPAETPQDGVSVIVEDCETGQTGCYIVDLHGGATRPC